MPVIAALWQPHNEANALAKGIFMFSESIQTTITEVEFHRQRSKIFLRWAWSFAFITFIVILVFAGYTQYLLKAVANESILMTQKVMELPQKDVTFPDFVALINENYFGYWAASGFLISLFASIGMLKHHANRASYFENEVLKLRKLQSISSIDEIKLKLATRVIDSCLNEEKAKNSKVVVSPLLDAISENTSKILEKVSSK